ncbi:hypothetical protein DB48_02470 [Shewanella sp. cp20]|nr:hypothetical protein DB48_02470 [Shewanella sp. cp20]
MALIFLHEIEINQMLLKPPLAKGFEKTAALIAEHLRLEQLNIWNVGIVDLHSVIRPVNRATGSKESWSL